MNFIKEICLIGLKDWLWWTLKLRRNEHHPSLALTGTLPTSQSRLDRRMRAHKIAVALDIHYNTYPAAYAFWLRMAIEKGWCVPLNDSINPASWLNYWEACYDSERRSKLP